MGLVYFIFIQPYRRMNIAAIVVRYWMYFTKASKTLRFFNRIDDNITRGTYVFYYLFNREIKKTQ
jgi:hypothetical protein